MEYKIVQKMTISQVEVEVNRLIKKGYEPIGGITYVKEYYPYVQAMIKKDQNKKEVL